MEVSAGRVRGVWQRHGLLTKHERLLRLEKATTECQVELREEQVRLLECFSPEFRERHIEGKRAIQGVRRRESCCRGGAHPIPAHWSR